MLQLGFLIQQSTLTRRKDKATWIMGIYLHSRDYASGRNPTIWDLSVSYVVNPTYP